MRVKTYQVWIRDEWYLIDAPNKRIAKWCAFNLFTYEFMGGFVTVKDVKKIKRIKCEEEIIR